MPLRSPFDATEPHPLARAAAEALQCALEPRTDLFTRGAGKMFGVLVAENAHGQHVELHAFSGQLGGQWLVPGFVPPLFDAVAREAVERPGVELLRSLTARHERLADLETPVAALRARHKAELLDLDARHRAAKADRDLRRGAGAPPDPLAQESRRDKAAKRWMLQAHAEEFHGPTRALRRLAASERLRAFVSRRLMQQIFDCYHVRNARGDLAPLRSLYPSAPPSGAGDCAAAKLLGAAFAQNLKPIAMAEFFWGEPSAESPRRSGEFSAACRLKCGPLLPFMLQGLDVEPPRGLGAGVASAPLHVLYEDAWVLAVEKPAGLLSVPGRTPDLEDSVQTRLQQRFPDARLVHRLDLDTSGVLIAALGADAYRTLQHQFAARSVEKRYLAWVEGAVEATEGSIDLPIRVDLNDRPRQIHDPLHGRAASTAFRVLERKDGRTRLELSPRTGRTHQLRVHAALGLKAPIVGDRLYGRRGDRLLLHASAISFRHPHSGELVHIESQPPF